MDSVIFQAMAIALNRKLASSRIDRVIQVTAGTVVFKLWTGQEKVQLLLKADGRGCFYLTRLNHAAPAAPPRFCQLLRARLRRLLEIRTEPLDRIVHFIFSGAQGERYSLILEAIGAQGNLLLVNESGCIVDLLWRQEGQRVLLPGKPYLLPEQHPRSSLLGERGKLLALLDSAHDQRTMARLDIAPMSPALAQAICLERSAGRSLGSILDDIQTSFRTGQFQAYRVAWGDVTGMLPLPLGLQGCASADKFDELSLLFDSESLGDRSEPDRGLTARLAAVVARQRKRCLKRLENIAEEGRRHGDPESLRIMGDLLLTNLHRIRRGDESVEVDDYFRSPESTLEIRLDPMQSPQENAERYYKLYRKARRAVDHHQRRRLETEQEIAWLDQVALALDDAETADDLYAAQLELESAGLLKETRGQLGRRQPLAPEHQLLQSVSPAGLKLFWGKNSRTNDYVSRRLAGPDDLWFHAHNLPGCHLVLKCTGKTAHVSEDDILFAAAYAAGYSKGKASGKVEVMVARGQDVRKPKGARPGLVTVDAYRTVLVAPRRLDNA